MKIKVNLKHLLITTAVILIAACNGTTSSGGGGSTPQTTTVTVPSSTQVRTPTSAQTNLSSSTSIISSSVLSKQNATNLKNLSNSSCIQLVPQPNGQNFTTAFNSNQWWSTATVTFQLTNTCMGSQSFTANVAFHNALLNGSPVPISGWNIQQNGNPYMSVTSTGGATPQLVVSTPACSDDWCNWAQLAAGQVITLIANLGYGNFINDLHIDSVDIIDGTIPIPAPQTSGSINLNLAATSQTTQACANASANCNFQVNVISPAGVNVESATINANQANISNYVINNLLPGQYTIQVVPSSVPSLSSGTIDYTYTPANTIAVVAGSTATTTTINFSYTANAVNSVTVNLAGIPNSMFNSNTILGRIVDSNKVQIGTMTFTSNQLSQTIASRSFVTGQQYTVQIQGLGDPKTGIYYAPIQMAPFTVASGNNTVNAAYDAPVTSNLYNIKINIPNTVAGQTISYGADPANDTTDPSYISFATDSLSSGTYTFPSQLVTTMTPSTVGGYSTAMSPQNTVTSSANGLSYSVINTAATSTLQFFVDSSATTPLTTLTLNSVPNQTNQQIIFVENLGKQAATVPSSASFNSTITGLSVSASTCGTTLASGAICSLTLTYTPKATGSGNTVMSFGANLPITTNVVNQTTPIMAEYYCGFSGSFCGQSTNNDVNSATKLVILAFANINNDGSITADNAASWPTSFIPTWQSGNGHVILSIGGQNAWWSSVYNNSQSINNFVNSVIAVLTQYNIDGVDLDIENGSATPQQIADSINLLRVAMNNSNNVRLNQDKGIITVAPQNVGVMQNQPIIGANVNSGVSNTNFFVNVFNASINSLTYAMQQDYNNWYYGLNAPDQTTMLEASYLGWLNVGNQWGSQTPMDGYVGVPASKLIMGVPASNSAGSVYLPTVTGVTTAIPAINTTIAPAKMAGVMMWDSHWDAQNSTGQPGKYCYMSKSVAQSLSLPAGTCPTDQ